VPRRSRGKKIVPLRGEEGWSVLFSRKRRARLQENGASKKKPTFNFWEKGGTQDVRRSSERSFQNRSLHFLLLAAEKRYEAVASRRKVGEISKGREDSPASAHLLKKGPAASRRKKDRRSMQSELGPKEKCSHLGE